MQIIELFGLPGCGKSTLLSEVLSNDDDVFLYEDYRNFIKTLSFTQKIGLCLRFMKHNRGLWRLFRQISHVGFAKTTKAYCDCLKFLSKLGEFVRSAERPVVLDQGVLQYAGTTLVRLALGDYDRDKVTLLTTRLIDLWDFKAVYLRVPKDIANSRAEKRAQSYSYDTLPAAKREEIYDYLEWSNQIITEAVPSDRIVTINLLESDDFDIDDAKRVLKEMIRCGE